MKSYGKWTFLSESIIKFKELNSLRGDVGVRKAEVSDLSLYHYLGLSLISIPNMPQLYQKQKTAASMVRTLVSDPQ